MVHRLIPRLSRLKFLFPPQISSAPLLPITRVRPLTNLPQRHTHARFFHHFPPRRDAPPSPRDAAPEDPNLTIPPNATMSQKLKHLIKVYGWYALGVYVVLSALDFGVAFAGINLLGAEYVSGVAENVKSAVANVFYSRPADPGLDEFEQANAGQTSHEGLYAMLVLAYTIHKTLFLPVRVGLTAAVTPKLVGWLGRRGWVGSEGTKRVATEMRERLRGRVNRHD